MKRLLLPRPSALIFILLFLAGLASGPQMLNTDGDLPRHLLMGKYVLEHGSAPTNEVFAYPYAGREYVPHEWLAGVVYYLAYVWFDLDGVVLLAGILIATTFTLIFIRALTNSNEHLLAFLIVLLGAVVSSIHWVVRPHLFTMVFLAIWLIGLDRLNRGKTVKWWAFPMLMLAWANMHAEYIIGFLVLLAYLAGSIWSFWSARDEFGPTKIRMLFLILVTSLIASLVNPTGYKAWTTIAGYVNNEYLMSRISETRPPDLLASDSLPLVLLLAFAVFLFLRRKEAFKPADMLVIGGIGFMSVVSTRNAHLFGVVAPLVLSHGLKGIQVPQSFQNVGQMFARLDNRGQGTLFPMLLIVLFGASLLAIRPRMYNQFDPDVFPVDAVEWLENHPQTGNMFNAFDWGGYILLHLWPSQTVFIESQTDTNGELTRSYERVVTQEPGWESVFLTYEVTWAIIPPDWPLTRELRSMGWTAAYEDTTAVILVRR